MKKIVAIAIAVFASLMVAATLPRFAQAADGIQYNIVATAKEANYGGFVNPVDFHVTYTLSAVTYTDVTKTTEWHGSADEGTTVTVTQPQQYIPNEQGSGGMRYSFAYYDPTSPTVTMDQAHTITLWYAKQYLLTVKTNGLPNGYVTLVYLNGVTASDDYTIGVINDASTDGWRKWFDAPAFSFTPTIGVQSTVNGPAGTVYNFDHWSDASTTNPHAAMALTGPITLTANYVAVSLPVPEYWLGPIVGLTGCFAALGVFRLAKRKHL